jgi:hypothetical protein
MTGVDDLTRDMVRRADQAASKPDVRSENGVFASVLVAELFDLVHDNDSADWYDCRNPRTGTKFEVKSMEATIDGRDEDSRVEVDGRFRLWESQMRSLANAAGADGQSAWVVFVLLDERGDPVNLRRVKVSTVYSWVHDEMDGWDESGHDNEDLGRQQKLPAEVVFS